MPPKMVAAGGGALGEARELVALVASLSEAGDALTAQAVASKLGVSLERAEKLIELVLTASVGDGLGLPLIEEKDGVSLLTSRGVRGRRLRLTRAETVALLAALDRMGTSGADELRDALEASLETSPVDDALVRRTLGAGAGSVREQVAACSQAILSGSALGFSYRRVDTRRAERRRALPLRLRCEHEAWYLDAADLDRGGERTFRLDRMSDVALEGAPRDEGDTAAREGERGARGARVVRIRLLDPRLLDLLPWHDLRIVERSDDGSIVAETPYYGGSWLVRMLAACGDAARTDDDELADLVRAHALGQLERVDGRARTP